jgi:hypothetical protein
LPRLFSSGLVSLIEQGKVSLEMNTPPSNIHTRIQSFFIFSCSCLLTAFLENNRNNLHGSISHSYLHHYTMEQLSQLPYHQSHVHGLVKSAHYAVELLCWRHHQLALRWVLTFPFFVICFPFP